jgi:hypothetical protein
MPNFEQPFEPLDIAPEDLLPPTPKRPAKPPLQPRDDAGRLGGGLFGKMSIKKHKPDASCEQAMDNLMGGAVSPE